LAKTPTDRSGSLSSFSVLHITIFSASSGFRLPIKQPIGSGLATGPTCADLPDGLPQLSVNAEIRGRLNLRLSQLLLGHIWGINELSH
jgi:hypothetical protein